MRPQPLEASARLLLLLPLWLAPLAAGCSSQPWKKHVLHSKDGIVLYAEHEEAESGPVPQGFLHPVHVPPGTMDAILSQIVFKHRPLIGRPEDLLLFEKQDVEALSEPLRLALERLTPDQRLRFLIVRDTWASLLTGPKATSGVLFVKEEGVLNVAVDRIRESVTIAEGGNPADVSFPYEPTEYLDGDPLIPFGGTKLHVDTASNQRFPRWLEVELAEVRPAPEAAAPAAVAATGTSPGAPAGTATGAGAATGAGTATGATSSTAGASTAGASPGVTAGVGEDEEYTELKQKLETLRRLKEDGVLTEEQYQEQFQKIMSEL